MRFVVTAGPTREWIDPVRFISNPSTGKMGFAVARAARAAGHGVTLVAGPVALPTPPGVMRIDVATACEMLASVKAALAVAPQGETQALVMCAAVADWRPAETAGAKLKKREMDGVLRLVRNPDILKSTMDVRGVVRVGFAAETGAPAAEAARKCREKRLALVVGNDVTEPGSGFGTDTNRVVFVTPDGAATPLPMMGKLAVARRIVRFVENAAHG